MVGTIVRATWPLVVSIAISLPAPAEDEPKLASAADLPAITWDNTKQGWFVTSLLLDPQGRLWVGTEDRGL